MSSQRYGKQKMIEKILWPTESLSRNSRICFVVSIVVSFGFLFFLKSRSLVWDRDLSLNLFVLIYASIASYGFMFDSDIPAPPYPGGFDRADASLQHLRLVVFLLSIILLCYLTFSGGWLIST